MIVCVAVVGHQNNPLYIESFTEAEDALKLHHIVHCSLDVIDERVNNPRSKSETRLKEAFLGLLYPPLNYKVSSGSSTPHTWMPSQTLSMFLAKRSLPHPSPNIVTSYSFN
ncbi:Trafficking protein particle complex subunit 2 protein [Raphanus sativus]|nr:Trafficking protein particle complex subunit 2 protein [Raphanus sativus]